MPLSAGTRLGPYEILLSIGAGGMGEVYKARDTRLNRVVAIKCLRPQSSARFEQEARAVAALNHPHICQIFDVGADYLVLEFVEGAPLQGPVPAAEALPLALQIASALEAAHKRGILHRDLKPANVLVTDSGAKLLDFGLAKLTGESDIDSTQTTEGTLLGTAAYMSPEQAQGRPVDARSDIFSFGAVLYELLSGRRAFGGDSFLETLNSVVNSDPPPLDCPAFSIIQRCLAKDPAQRFQNGLELKEALRAAMEQPSAPARLRPSIAVLPFANMSGDAEQEYFSDGLTEEIINALAQIPDLKVIARTSAFAFKGQNLDVRKIAGALGVTHVLEGSVRKAGNRIRVTAQLIAAADGGHLWSERYDGDLEDIFAVQDATAASIANALELKLAAGPRKYTPKLPAYEAFLRARHHIQRWSPDSAVKAQHYMYEAAALDPAFALPHCELGWCYFTLATENRISPGEAARMIREEAQAALAIDPALGDARAMRAMAAVLDYDWEEAGRDFAWALSHGPVQPLTRAFYSVWYLAPVGRMEEAEEQMRLSLEEDPLNIYSRVLYGAELFTCGRSEEGERLQAQILELDPNVWLAYVWRAAHHAARGRLAEALADAAKGYELAPWNVIAVGLHAGLLALTGDQAAAEKRIGELANFAAFGAPCGHATYHGLCSEIDAAADWYEKAIEQRDTRAPWITANIIGERLTSHPRWRALRRMMRLPE
jgi:eukaryotic-like serine/threonine-protein kinase